MSNQRGFSKHFKSSAKRVQAFLSLTKRLGVTPKMVGLGLVAIALACAAIAVPLQRGWVVRPQEVREEPNNATTRLALGHALFAEGKREPAIKAYDHELARDKDIGDEKMYENLASCYGTEEQGAAASLIARHKLVKIHDRLSALASNKHHKTRWGAVQTLEKIGKGSRTDFEQAWIADLESSDCEVRRRAVEGLGKAGDRRALEPIRHAKKKDEATKKGFLMFSSTCLGDRPTDAEKKILARR